MPVDSLNRSASQNWWAMGLLEALHHKFLLEIEALLSIDTSTQYYSASHWPPRDVYIFIKQYQIDMGVTFPELARTETGLWVLGFMAGL